MQVRSDFPAAETFFGDSMAPYIDDIIDHTCKIRTFDPEKNALHEYVWHRDEKDREVTVLGGEGWKIQFDNELPQNININDTFFIPKMIYHRIIPGKTKLRIKINEKL
jgi:hypothetical protein